MKINLSETNQRQLPFIAIVPFLLITFGLAWGSSGVGFYYAGDTPAYHTLQDNVTEIDRRSIQHNGSYALSLPKHSGNLDLKTLTATQNAVYFNSLPNVVVHYPEAQVLPLAVVTSILFVTVVWLGFRARRLTPTGIGLGVIAFLLSAIGVMVLAILGWWLMRSLNPSLQVFLMDILEGKNNLSDRG